MRAERDIRYKIPIHHVDMEHIRVWFKLLKIVVQVSEIRA